MIADKSTAYGRLVAERKACRACSGLTNPSVCAEGAHDSAEVGPWSLWQGDLDADLMIIGQDWGDENYFVDNAGRESRNNPTNETLRRLLSTAGIVIERPAPECSKGSLFFTNAILCLKRGGMQSRVKALWFKDCGERFLRPTIEIVRPRFLVTLGERAYRAVAPLYGHPRRVFKAAVEREDGFPLSHETTLFPMYHCGARILNTHRPIDKQIRDWARIRRAIQAAR